MGAIPKTLTAKWPAPAFTFSKAEIVEFFSNIDWKMMAVADMENPQRQMFALFR